MIVTRVSSEGHFGHKRCAHGDVCCDKVRVVRVLVFELEGFVEIGWKGGLHVATTEYFMEKWG